jgi:hypothetical protein
MFAALNVKHTLLIHSKITDAIIINFIYYRHSVLNVCLPQFLAECLTFGFFFASRG